MRNASFLLLAVFCVLDAILTLAVVSRGAAEANPVLRDALASGPVLFLAVKAALTVPALALFWVAGARRVVWGVALVYGAVVARSLVWLAS